MDQANHESGIKKWAEELHRRVGSKWSSVQKDYPNISVLAAGWGVFYSPIHLPLQLMIIGRNPGGGKESFDQEVSLRIPNIHEYFDESLDCHGRRNNDYPLARKTIKLFAEMGLTSLLAESVKFNLLFFRSRSISAKSSDDGQAWTTVPRKLRQGLESFCEEHVIEIIQKLEPRIILAEGIGTYQRLKDLLRTQGISLDANQEVLHKVNRRVVYARTENSRPMLLGILHLSGARPSNEELNTIRSFLSVDLSRQS